MCTGFEAALIAATVAGTGASVQQSTQAKHRAKGAREQAVRDAEEARTQKEREFAALNKRKPNMQGLNAASAKRASTGIASTQLTGPGGVDPATLSLSRTTLLGG